jgi:acrylyl-CoA reductase (NADPH)
MGHRKAMKQALPANMEKCLDGGEIIRDGRVIPTLGCVPCQAVGELNRSHTGVLDLPFVHHGYQQFGQMPLPNERKLQFPCREIEYGALGRTGAQAAVKALAFVYLEGQAWGKAPAQYVGDFQQKGCDGDFVHIEVMPEYRPVSCIARCPTRPANHFEDTDQCSRMCFYLTFHRGQVGELPQEGRDAHHHDGALDRGDVVVLPGLAVGLNMDQHLQGHHRIAQYQCCHRAPVDALLLFPHRLEFLDRMLEDGNGFVAEKRHVGIEGVKGLVDQGHGLLPAGDDSIYGTTAAGLRCRAAARMRGECQGYNWPTNNRSANLAPDQEEKSMSSVVAPFKAFVIRQDENRKVCSAMETLSVDALDAGEVLIKVAYSSVNYKDALAATGAGKIIRRFPCIGGIDLSGTVVESADPRFKVGDEVIATSFDIGVAHHGGYAEYARIPAAWVVPLPAGLSLFDSMALGTAGFTAALGVVRMEDNGLRPENGPVIVTGASGGVGGLAIDMLAGLGYHVVALTGKPHEEAYLKDLGAKEIRLRDTIDPAKTRPLDAGLWAGAVDNVGGDILAWVLSTMKQAGTVASIGNAQSIGLPTTVFPFILRGVSLLGIDSGYMGFPTRSRVWERLATDLKPRHLAQMTRTVPFSELPGVFDDFIAGRVKGRTVIAVNS